MDTWNVADRSRAVDTRRIRAMWSCMCAVEPWSIYVQGAVELRRFFEEEDGPHGGMEEGWRAQAAQ